MSTRSIIVLTSAIQTVRIYKHSDGYPNGNLPVIARAIEACGARKGARKKLDKKLGYELNVNTLAQAVLAEGELDPRNLEETFKEPFRPTHLGVQEDLEWLYVVDIDAKTVSVYGERWTGESPQVAFKKGTTDPMVYAKQMCEEYQERERESIRAAMKEVEATGFKLNPPKKPKRGKLAKAARQLQVA